MIGFRERERARSERRAASGARVVIFFLSVTLVFALLSSFLFVIHNESRSNYSIKPPSLALRRESRSFRRALSHEPSSSSTTAQASIYEEDKRLIHTGPNPLHN